MYKVWIGNRESEILTYNVFDESITFYGSNKLSNSSFMTSSRRPSNYGKEFRSYVIDKIENIIINNRDVEFHFYNPMFAHRILSEKPEWEKHFMNINNYEMLKWITSKTFVREWMSNSVLVPSYALLSKKECSISNLKELFNGFSKFIIQKDVSGGGEGTYLLTTISENEIHRILKTESLYLVSPYYSPKTSICCHMLINSKEAVVFPFGLQQSELQNNKILYKGTSYKDTLNLDSSIEQELLNNALTIGKRLKELGYRGICGLDFILYNNHIFFIEVNSRYLGSSFLINKALNERNYPSLFELNTLCFTDKIDLPCDIIKELKIGYASNVIKSQDQLKDNGIKDFIERYKNNCSKDIFFDGAENAKAVAENTYLFREIY